MTRVPLLAFVCAATSCSLMGLDDLDLQDCDQDLDCYALAPMSSHGLRTCYRCEAGRCEERGVSRARSVDALARLSWVSTSSVPQQRTLLALGPDDPVLPTRGLVLGASASGELSSIAYLDGESPQLRALALGAFDATHLIGLTLDTETCANGRIRLGTAEAAAPFALRPGGARTLFTTGVDLEPGTQCTRGGARSPALAILAPAEALAIWTAANQTDEPAVAAECTAARSATIHALRLGLHADADGASFAPLESPRPSVLAEGARAEVAPQLAALGDGYVFAYADGSGIQLRAIAAFGGTPSPAAAFALDDTDVTRIALSPGGSDGGAQRLLVVWTTGCGAHVALRGAVVAVGTASLALAAGPFAIAHNESIVSGPAVSFAPGGFDARRGSGGWTIVWSDGSRVFASRVSQRAAQLGPPDLLHSGDARLVFMSSPRSGPFAFGFVQESNAHSDEVVLMGCE